ncbi:MAG: 30S ribosomal protein THX [Ferruginibacter sp.]
MGRGDIKTKKGKIFAGSFGKTRSAKTVKPVAKPAANAPAAATVVAAPVKRSAAKKEK